jgi:hypothetical protein
VLRLVSATPRSSPKSRFRLRARLSRDANTESKVPFLHIISPVLLISRTSRLIMSFNTNQPESTPPTSSYDEVFHTPGSKIARSSSPLQERESSSFSNDSWGGFSLITLAPIAEANKPHNTAFSNDEFSDDEVGFTAKPSFKDAYGGP